jgi:hypothetical protein
VQCLKEIDVRRLQRAEWLVSCARVKRPKLNTLLLSAKLVERLDNVPQYKVCQLG